MRNYRKLLGLMVVVMVLCFFSSNVWSAGTAKSFTVDLSKATFSKTSTTIYTYDVI